MADHHQPPAPSTISARLREDLSTLVTRKGVRASARETGLSRDSLLGLLAGTRVKAGTIAIAERWHAELHRKHGKQSAA